MIEKDFDIEEPIIFCSHNFDISDRETFANDLANRLGVNINITEGADVILDSTINFRQLQPKASTTNER